MTTATEGKLFTFYKDPYRRIPVFLSGNAPRCVVWTGGQGDGFFSLGYMQQLIDELGHVEWSVAQWTPASSFVGYGGQCHHRDAEDLDELLGELVNTYGMRELCLFATSTGVQVVLEALERGRYREYVSRVVLQGIVANVNSELFAATTTQARLAKAKALVSNGVKEDISAMEGVYDIPITPARYATGGYPSIQEALWVPALINDVKTLRSVLSVINVPLLVMISMHSDFTVTEKEQEAFESRVKGNSATTETFISYFNDTSDERRRMLKASEAQHTAAVVFFLAEQDEKRRQREQAISQAQAEQDRRSKSILAQSSFQHRIQ